MLTKKGLLSDRGLFFACKRNRSEGARRRCAEKAAGAAVSDRTVLEDATGGRGWKAIPPISIIQLMLTKKGLLSDRGLFFARKRNRSEGARRRCAEKAAGAAVSDRTVLEDATGSRGWKAIPPISINRTSRCR